ncbi:hypothetical protein GY45DRAFT_1336489 [Cubamyces sp. BRFM 1775]|nr:hypothetical protein GY45DRAFT_1336489 [Cubamyces sp. BRFM 1775]
MSESTTAIVATKPHGGSVQVLIDRASLEEDTRTRADSAAAIRETILTAFDPARTLDGGSLRGPFAILPPNLTLLSVPPSLQDYLRQLTVCANAAAASLACGSILAGHASEADEYGDIAFWLGEGDYDKGHELEILQSLSLQDMVPEHGHFKEVEISPKTGLPVTVNASANATAEVTSLFGLLRQMSAIRAFCVPGELSIYILIGRYGTGSLSGWSGLLGLGVQS